MLKKFSELSNGFISRFKLTSHGINKKKDIETEGIPEMTSTVSEKARKPSSYSATANFSSGQISIPITKKDHYAILDFSHNSKK